MQPNSPYGTDPNQPPAGVPPQSPQLPQPAQPQVYAPQPQPTQQAYPPNQQPVAPQSPQYEFIMNPNQPGSSRKFNMLPQSNSMLRRILLVLGGLIILVILLSIGKSLLSNKPNLTSYISIVQDQQEIIHLVTTAATEKSLSTTNKNFAITTQLSLTTGQSQVIKYLQQNGQKINDKQLGLKISAATDEKLTTASTANNYNPVFQEVMTSQLTSYQQAIKQAANGAGPKGRDLLNNQLKAATLLLQQLSAPNS